MYRAAAPRGLSDPAEDVCAAAARAVRLVMRRFLSPVGTLEAPKARTGGGAPQSGDSGGGGSASVAEGTVLAAEVERGAPAFARDRGGGTTGGGGGGGGDVFDLVWKALEDLDQDSACVEVCASCDFGKHTVRLLSFVYRTSAGRKGDFE